MIALKQHVDGIVRPIRASERRKDRMREELLAHLTHLYEQELAAHAADPSGRAGGRANDLAIRPRWARTAGHGAADRASAVRRNREHPLDAPPARRERGTSAATPFGRWSSR